MTENPHLSPVILYSDDAKAVHDALLASGHSELAEKIRQKSHRSRLDKMYAELSITGSDDDFDHDDEPIVAQGDSGAYVLTWRWIEKDQIRQMIRETRKSKRSV